VLIAQGNGLGKLRHADVKAILVRRRLCDRQ